MLRKYKKNFTGTILEKQQKNLTEKPSNGTGIKKK
jgi:hypothetical protein